MLRKLAGYGQLGAQLLLIELFLPGGTLVILTLLLARRCAPARLERWVARVPFGWTPWPVAGSHRPVSHCPPARLRQASTGRGG
jgi:hypothetical protein